MYGVAGKTAHAIYDWIQIAKNIELIHELQNAGVKILPYKSPVKANKLEGKSFVVTGTLPTISRDDMHKKMWAALALALCAPMAFAAGAIAVDDEQGESAPGYGFVTGADSRAEAGAQALKECKKQGNDSCKVVVRFDQCGAYAASSKFYGVGWGKSKTAAESMAVEKCGNGKCKVVVSDCE